MSTMCAAILFNNYFKYLLNFDVQVTLKVNYQFQNILNAFTCHDGRNARQRKQNEE